MKIARATNLTALASASAIATAAGFATTPSPASIALTVFAVTGAGLCIGFLLVGSARWVGVSSVPILAAVVLEAGFNDEPSWIRPVLLGCLWFLTLELAWEAIERREPAEYRRDVDLRRIQEVAAVVGIAAATGTVAAALATYAPLRSVLVQALVIGTVLAGFVTLIRRISPRGSLSGE